MQDVSYIYENSTYDEEMDDEYQNKNRRSARGERSEKNEKVMKSERESLVDQRFDLGNDCLESSSCFFLCYTFLYFNYYYFIIFLFFLFFFLHG